VNVTTNDTLPFFFCCHFCSPFRDVNLPGWNRFRLPDAEQLIDPRTQSLPPGAKIAKIIAVQPYFIKGKLYLCSITCNAEKLLKMRILCGTA
jgi:hypothetical protein